jgi:hypothetical protein
MDIDATLRIDAAVPEPPRAVTTYRASGPLVFARGDDKLRALVERRVRTWRRHFKVEGEPRDLGDRVLLLDDRQSLEVFVPTESVWWSHRELAFAEHAAAGPVPDEKDAVARATEILAGFGGSDAGWSVTRVGTTNAGVSTSPDDTGELVPTMVTVTFGLHYDDVPVAGPGARVRVSLAGDGQLAEFAQFWRQVSPAEEVEPIHPWRAIERVASGPRFREAREAGLVVVIEGVRLVHYSAGPGVAQRYLVPCYEVTGRVEGNDAVDDAFTLYAPVVDVSPESLKSTAVRHKAHAGPVFAAL